MPLSFRHAAGLPAALAAAGLLAAPAGAAEPSAKSRAAVLQAIVDCRAVTDAERRLACFDQASAVLDQAEASGQVVVLDREQTRKVRKEVFGLDLPAIRLFSGGDDKDGGGPDSEDVDRITDTIETATQGGDGKWVLVLKGGAVWRQTDQQYARARQGAPVEIRRGAIGSYLMNIDGQRAIRVRRDR